MEDDPDRTVCDPQAPDEAFRAVSWSSNDGRHWTRTPLDWPFGKEFTEGATVMGTWYVNGAFEMLVQSRWVPVMLVLRSDDGVSWREVARFNHNDDADTHAAIAADGTRAIAMTSRDSSQDQTTLSMLTSADGETWTEVQTPFSGTHDDPADGPDWAGKLFSPKAPLDNWAVLIERSACFETDRRATMWTSPDLVHWQSADIPWIVPRTEGVFATRYGLVALGGQYCDLTGSEGPQTPDGDRLLLTRDGLTWQPLRPRQLRNFEVNVVDGPAGVFLITQDGRVWSTGG